MAAVAASGSSTSLHLTLGPPVNNPSTAASGRDRLNVPTEGDTCCPTAPVAAPVYVMSPDGSSLWLLDSSRKPAEEQPPPYSTPQSAARSRSSTYSGRRVQRPLRVRSVSYPSQGQVEEREPHHGWRSIIYGDEGDAEADEAEPVTESTPLLHRESRWNAYWRPVGKSRYWRPLIHLILINFPLNLLVWPLLLVGSLVGTVLLITLPIGVVVWWLTLIIARWAAREEIKLQKGYHLGSDYNVHPRAVFYRLREVQVQDGEDIFVWDTRFFKCSWDMLADYYSYSAVVYFLLVKPLAILLPTVLLIAFLPVSVILFPLLPVYLRAARWYGQWQARVAVDNV